jgi:hypothetical protein
MCPSTLTASEKENQSWQANGMRQSRHPITSNKRPIDLEVDSPKNIRVPEKYLS